MTATSPRGPTGSLSRRLGAARLAAIGLLASSCELPPPGSAFDPGEPARVDCSACHLAAELGSPRSAAPPRDWLLEAGAGIVRDPAVLSLSGAPVLSLAWPRRGHHGPGALEDCSGCHPVYRRTSGHGRSVYPEAAAWTAFAGAEGCGPGCHEWLGEVEARGFAPASGPVSGHEGSIAPADLLAADLAAGSGHGRLWAEGLARAEADGGRLDDLGLRVSLLESGCGGCHNRFVERHGAIATCTDCHALGFSRSDDGHARHLGRIEAERATRAPGLGDASACALCHCSEPGSEPLCRAACYNCHLSGHRPAPVLWTGG